MIYYAIFGGCPICKARQAALMPRSKAVWQTNKQQTEFMTFSSSAPLQFHIHIPFSHDDQKTVLAQANEHARQGNLSCFASLFPRIRSIKLSIEVGAIPRRQHTSCHLGLDLVTLWTSLSSCDRTFLRLLGACENTRASYALQQPTLLDSLLEPPLGTIAISSP